MSDILLLLGVITETGQVCFNYKEGLTRPAEKKNEPPSVPTLRFGFKEGPATSPQPAGLQPRLCPGGSGLSCSLADVGTGRGNRPPLSRHVRLRRSFRPCPTVIVTINVGRQRASSWGGGPLTAAPVSLFLSAAPHWDGADQAEYSFS